MNKSIVHRVSRWENSAKTIDRVFRIREIKRREIIRFRKQRNRISKDRFNRKDFEI